MNNHIEKQVLHRQDQAKQLEMDKNTRFAIEKHIGELRRDIAHKQHIISTQVMSGDTGRSLALKREEVPRTAALIELTSPFAAETRS